MGVYWISRNNIALHYISVVYHEYHSNYRICHTYHGVYMICFQWPTNVTSCPVRFYFAVLLSTVDPYRGAGGGWSRGGGTPSLTTVIFVFTLTVLWLDCGCWCLLLPVIHPYLRITEMVGPFCHIYWQKLTDNGKIGVESIFILQNNHNDNQQGDWKGQICVSHIL